MNRSLPYIIGAIVLLLIIGLVFSTRTNRHTFDDRMSFNRRDKIPYGLYIAYQSLSHIFPNAPVFVNQKAPAYWESLNSDSEGQALIAIVPSFRADEYEMKRLIDFIKNGNSVFISTAMVSYQVQTMLHCEIPDVFDINDNLSTKNTSDSFSVSLAQPPFSKNDEFGCPGKRFESYFSKFDSGISTVYGNGIYVLPNLLEFRAGKGSLFFHLTPLAFSNYFLLRDKNINYYNKVLSLIPKNTSKVVWDEYFLHKRYSDSEENKSIFSALMSQRAFRAALWLLLILLGLFIFQEMRRKQRMIPVMSKPKNDSLEFVKTIGRLYFEKGDNKNLARKMTAYFLEHIRNRYKLPTSSLDDEFVLALRQKTTQPENNIRRIVSFINNIDARGNIADNELSDFHKALEEFYKTG